MFAFSREDGCHRINNLADVLIYPVFPYDFAQISPFTKSVVQYRTFSFSPPQDSSIVLISNLGCRIFNFWHSFLFPFVQKIDDSSKLFIALLNFAGLRSLLSVKSQAFLMLPSKNGWNNFFMLTILVMPSFGSWKIVDGQHFFFNSTKHFAFMI